MDHSGWVAPTRFDSGESRRSRKESAMVAPLTRYHKIHFRQVDSYGATLFLSQTVGYRQRPPYNVNSNLTREVYEKLAGAEGTVSASSWGWEVQHPPFWGESALSGARNEARRRFVNKLGDASSFGATLTAERKETWATVVTVITRAAIAARHVAGFRFQKAAETLGIPYKEYKKRVRVGTVRRGRKRRPVYASRVFHTLPNGREALKTAASGWLLYSYGVKPLAEDIYNGMDVLQRPTPSHTVRGTGYGNVTYHEPPQNQWSTYTDSYSVKVSYQAEVRVNNPNLFLANKLGLINPAQWVLEGIPFSFVVDWFSNLSDVVNSMTDLAGLTLEKSSLFEGFDHSEMMVTTYPGADNRGKKRFVGFRTAGAMPPSATLTFAYERFSWQRGLNAISLLIGFLPKK